MVLRGVALSNIEKEIKDAIITHFAKIDIEYFSLQIRRFKRRLYNENMINFKDLNLIGISIEDDHIETLLNIGFLSLYSKTYKLTKYNS